MSEVTNPFVEAEDAERYQNFRPKYHDLPFQKLKQILGAEIPRALDVACGTGHSTEAIAKIADRVTGMDLSAAMLKEARAKNIHAFFVQAAAEEMPFDKNSFELVNISMAFHWTDQLRFLKEVRRVLTSGGHLSIDNYGFTGEMTDNPKFKELNQNFYRSKLPKVSRHSSFLGPEEMHEAGFRLSQEIPYEHVLHMSLAHFVGFIMTQSNFLMFDEDRRKETKLELTSYYAPFFGNEERPLLFSGLLKLYSVANPL